MANAQYFVDVPASGPNATLNTVFYTFAASNFDSNTLTINVGNAGVNWGWKEPLLDATVPEPSTLALMSCGGIILIVGYWRRRRHPLSTAPVPALFRSDQQSIRSTVHRGL